MMNRRTFLRTTANVAALPLAARAFAAAPLKLKQGVTRMVFGSGKSVEECCRVAQSVGATGFDFIDDPNDWPTLRRYGMVNSMLRADFGGGKSEGRPPDGPLGWHAVGLKEAQGEYFKAVHDLIDVAARERFPNVIVLAGSKNRVSAQEGADNAVDFLAKLAPHAEQKGVTVCMELLNKFGFQAPPNSLFDNTGWGVDVCKRVGSTRVKILYDVFHAQLSEGNIVQNIRNNIAQIGHIHTGSVPGRHELFRDNEVDYRFVARTLEELKFSGFVTHEWTPSPDSDVREDLMRSAEIMNP
ncbi:MAG: sugar phosphate isomerase/epimerase family protein [Pseudomonadota bacterium]